MAHIYAGWAPPDRIRRSVALPIDLDRRISTLANSSDSTPSTVLSDALKLAVAESCHEADEVTHADAEEYESLIRRVIVLDSSVNEALDERVSALRFGHNGHAAELDFSDLVTALVENYLDHFNGNGNGSNGNGSLG
jgi:hypothetical protein